MNTENDYFRKMNCTKIAEILKTLSHPGRLMILCQLAGGEKTVTELEKNCDIAQSQVSQFLKRMQYEGFVDSRKEGKFVVYQIKDEKVLSLMQELHRIFDPGDCQYASEGQS